jgi:hypothetical protein
LYTVGVRKVLEPSQLLDAGTRRAWRAWLKGHAASAREIWLVFWKKHTGKAALSYNDAVEERSASADRQHRPPTRRSVCAALFTRNPRPLLPSEHERLRYLIKKGMVIPEVLPLDSIGVEEFTVAPDIVTMIKADSRPGRTSSGSHPPMSASRRLHEGARNRPAVRKTLTTSFG